MFPRVKPATPEQIAKARYVAGKTDQLSKEKAKMVKIFVLYVIILIALAVCGKKRIAH